MREEDRGGAAGIARSSRTIDLSNFTRGPLVSCRFYRKYRRRQCVSFILRRRGNKTRFTLVRETRKFGRRTGGIYGERLRATINPALSAETRPFSSSSSRRRGVNRWIFAARTRVRIRRLVSRAASGEIARGQSHFARSVSFMRRE